MAITAMGWKPGTLTSWSPSSQHGLRHPRAPWATVTSAPTPALEASRRGAGQHDCAPSALDRGLQGPVPDAQRNVSVTNIGKSWRTPRRVAAQRQLEHADEVTPCIAKSRSVTSASPGKL